MGLNALQPWHLIVLVAVVVVLFGAKRLPGAARGIGQSLRIFKAEMAAKDGKDEEKPSAPPAPPQLTEGTQVAKQQTSDQRQDRTQA
ncbi:MAG: Sec-independent protein translocase subunit TatA [Kutzneria sp.]|nr:Sec-independent protein translocase subunit TatA [Kutzneria sp.]MBV9844044.1 Sec-independent protein translocase subunit TatA [Kutzneria sp.]